MKKLFCLLLVLAVVLAGCRKPAAEVVATEQILPATSAEEAATVPLQTTQPEETEEQQTEETESAPTEPEITEPAHSDLYLEGVSVEDVIVWFMRWCWTVNL